MSVTFSSLHTSFIMQLTPPDAKVWGKFFSSFLYVPNSSIGDIGTQVSHIVRVLIWLTYFVTFETFTQLNLTNPTLNSSSLEGMFCFRISGEIFNLSSPKTMIITMITRMWRDGHGSAPKIEKPFGKRWIATGKVSTQKKYTGLFGNFSQHGGGSSQFPKPKTKKKCL